ncbi:hypothetical protein HPB49_001562 [Dermacentor silvarum]|uniref:Uncharacterized protein n=1 Tax=Dermacentor silvarum TaxID=543639 RepID=A0ACB8C6N5_DERSI|nr:hypothetical protein HPB49_001562 [Dermacentor silvarum]
MSPAEAIRLHESKLVVQENGYALVANSAVNPVPSAIYYWHKLWREENFGRDIDPLLKIAEKMPLYAKEGLDVKLGRSEDGQFWVVLVVTPIMKRTQELSAASEIIFIDSTSSCDASHSTLTVLLTATNAGAVPVAVLIHNSQSAECYRTAFTLLKENYPTCFGGLSYPQAFMTDNSAAEKAALQAVRPQGTQLLCFFHVAQAEWRWLTAARNNIGKEQRRSLMSAFRHDVDNNLEALFEQMRQIHAEEKGNETYRRHLLSGTKRLKRLQELKRGLGVMMAMDAALGLELRRGRCIKCSPQQLQDDVQSDKRLQASSSGTTTEWPFT